MWSKVVIKSNDGSHIFNLILNIFSRHQFSFAPSVFNVANINNGLCLAISNFLGLETLTSASQPIVDFLRVSSEEATPDPDGSFVERYRYVMEKNEKNGQSQSAFYGKRGEAHLQSTLLDFFVAGKSCVTFL